MRVGLLLVLVDENRVTAAEAAGGDDPVGRVPCHISADPLELMHVVGCERRVLLPCVDIPDNDLPVLGSGHQVLPVGAEVKFDLLARASNPGKPLDDDPAISVDESECVVAGKHEELLARAVHLDAVDGGGDLRLIQVPDNVEGVIQDRPDDQTPRRVSAHHLRLDRMDVQRVDVRCVARDDLQDLGGAVGVQRLLPHVPETDVLVETSCHDVGGRRDRFLLLRRPLVPLRPWTEPRAVDV
mmetsp:Transcript_26269/g.59630  ORF Transcript_26269/g.59630 Transcript_26269/m.59630 type:complete len:241 (-) Transcript_26269:2083-2805(-)